MNASLARFADDALRAMAGPAVYQRGADYARQKRVRLLSVGPDRVRAEVSGSEVYQVELTGAGRSVDGVCECPAYEREEVCKHIVATALTVNASPQAAAEAQGRREQVVAHVKALPPEQLAIRLIAWAERDPMLWRELELEVSLAADGDEKLLARLAAMVDAATDVDEFIDWQGAGAVAADIAKATETIAQALDAGRAGVALQALDRLLAEADDIMGSADDSDGEIYGAFCEARDLHLRACLATNADPVALAEDLFERFMAGVTDLWTDALDDYGDALGAAGAAAFMRLAREAWARRSDGERHASLRHLLDEAAERAGDFDTRLQLRLEDVSSLWDYVGLSDLCLNAGRHDEAIKWIEEGLWRFEDKPDGRVYVSAGRLHLRHGDRKRALELLWRVQRSQPSHEVHGLLAEAGEAEASLAVIRTRAEVRPERIGMWGGDIYRDLLIDVLCEADRIDQAWDAADSPGCSAHRLEKLAKATDASHPARCFAAYPRVVEDHVARPGGYQAGVDALARMDALADRLGRRAEQATFVADLALRHKRKRNFIKLLQTTPLRIRP